MGVETFTLPVISMQHFPNDYGFFYHLPVDKTIIILASA
jgi:hypothetical protein